MSSTYTPSEVAGRYGVGERTVLSWIAAGELRAVNVNRKVGSRKPRWRITPEALAAFEALRSPTPTPPRQRRRRATGDVINFY